MNGSDIESSTVLIIDDDPDIRWTLSALLKSEGFQTLEAEDGARALAVVRDGRADLMLLDLLMPGVNGLEILRLVRGVDADFPVILLTGHGTPDMAVEAGSYAVNGLLTKPFKNDEVALSVRAALATYRRIRREPSRKRLQNQGSSLHDLMGTSPAIQSIVARVKRVAPSEFTVVIEGETGVGKELVANSIHAMSRRSQGPFVAVDCGAIPATLIESELFGHEKGAFTGADHLRTGCFEEARGGTLFFDEIGNLPLAMQVRLLRALQERHFRRVGGAASIEMDVRVVVATNEDLDRLVKAGKFRQDLFYRLNEFRIVIPPLREHPEDIVFLAKRFLDEACHELHKAACVMTEEAVTILLAHSWSGNVRELRNIIRRAVLLAESMISSEHLQVARVVESCETPSTAEAAVVKCDPSFKDLMQDVTSEAERTILMRYLRITRGNLKKTAIMLHMDYKTMRTKARQYQLLPLEESCERAESQTECTRTTSRRSRNGTVPWSQ